MYKAETVFFGTFKEKLRDGKEIDIINNIYQEVEFAQYYEAVACESISSDIEYYLDMLSKNDRVLEIGTGNGRVLKPLLAHGIDIYGIEPEQAMLEFLNEEEKSRVYIGGIEKLTQFNHTSKYSYIIIPATSVSLFDEQIFSNFLSEAKKVLNSKGKIIFDFIGNGFLYNMVRILVGTLLEIGNKKRPVDDIPRVLAAKDRQEVRTTAPASGLYLQHVFYEEVPKKYRLDLKKD